MANVIMDALKQGFSQNLLFEPEDPQSGLVPSPGTPSTHLERFLYAMLLHADMPPRATRTYVYRDSNEQIFHILQVVPACASLQFFVEEGSLFSLKEYGCQAHRAEPTSMLCTRTGTADVHCHECLVMFVQRYMELGAWPVEHVASLRCQGSFVVVSRLAAILFNYTDNEYLRVVEPPEMLALLHVIAMLAQR